MNRRELIFRTAAVDAGLTLTRWPPAFPADAKPPQGLFFSTSSNLHHPVLHGDPYPRMLGTEFIIHIVQQPAKMRVVDPAFPGFDKRGSDFQMMDEWYSLTDFSKDLHVLLVQETQGMIGIPYKRPPYPATWA